MKRTVHPCGVLYLLLSTLRLDVSMNDALGIDIFETFKELVDEHQHGLERELAAAEVRSTNLTHQVPHFRTGEKCTTPAQRGHAAQKRSDMEIEREDEQINF